MSLATLAIILGLVVVLPNAYALWKPAAFGTAVRKFPRSVDWGYALMLAATFWFIWNVRRESIADFEPLKPALYALFLGVGIGACLFVKDFLAVRGLAVIFLLLAKVMVDAARWVETDWRLVITTWAYILVVAGIWFTISPWRMRDLLNWGTASEHRIRVGSAIRLAFGAAVIVLGLAVF
jgi:hypothetical protein